MLSWPVITTCPVDPDAVPGFVVDSDSFDGRSNDSVQPFAADAPPLVIVKCANAPNP